MPRLPFPSATAVALWLLGGGWTTVSSHRFPEMNGALSAVGGEAPKEAGSDETLSLIPGTARLPVLRYKFTSFATPVPYEAAEFCVKYFGATALTNRSDFLAHKDLAPEAEVAALRFYYTDNPQYGSYRKEKRFTDVYFVNDPTKASSAVLNVPAFNKYLHDTHRFEMQEEWDWYQDWHLCFEMWDDVDVLLYRLIRDGVPVVTRSTFSFYVEIPKGITFQIIGMKMDLVWTELFAFCRLTDGAGKIQELQIRELPDEEPPLPELLPPSHHSFFSSQAVAAQEFVTSFTSGKKVDLTQAWQSSHRYSDGTCAMLAWVEFEEFQVHFVEQFRKYQGEGLNVREIEEELTLLHGDMSRKDAFFDNHIGFEVEDLCPFVELLKHSNEPYLLDGSSLYIQLPGGIIFRLIGPSCPLDSNNLSISAV